VAFLDIDDTVRQTYGYAKQGAGRGCSDVMGLNALIATVSTPPAAPVIYAIARRRPITALLVAATNAHRYDVAICLVRCGPPFLDSSPSSTRTTPLTIR
jgi:hypothetical protein